MIKWLKNHAKEFNQPVLRHCNDPITSSRQRKAGSSKCASFSDNDNASSTFQLCTKSEVLDHWHTRNQFEPIREKLLKEEDVNLDKTISLREASRGQSATGSLGAVIKCFCGSACSTKRCNCFKAKLKCNSLFKMPQQESLCK